MTSPDLELFDAHPEWRPLLSAYHDQTIARDRDWCPRIAAAEETPPELASAVHGKLIALGLLKFEIASRTDGVQYQLTPLGRQALLPPDARPRGPEWAAPDEADAA